MNRRPVRAGSAPFLFPIDRQQRSAAAASQRASKNARRKATHPPRPMSGFPNMTALATRPPQPPRGYLDRRALSKAATALIHRQALLMDRRPVRAGSAPFLFPIDRQQRSAAAASQRASKNARRKATHPPRPMSGFPNMTALATRPPQPPRGYPDRRALSRAATALIHRPKAPLMDRRPVRAGIAPFLFPIDRQQRSAAAASQRASKNARRKATRPPRPMSGFPNMTAQATRPPQPPRGYPDRRALSRAATALIHRPKAPLMDRRPVRAGSAPFLFPIDRQQRSAAAASQRASKNARHKTTQPSRLTSGYPTKTPLMNRRPIRSSERLGKLKKI